MEEVIKEQFRGQMMIAQKIVNSMRIARRVSTFTNRNRPIEILIIKRCMG